jgi:hypothetical protein
MITKRLPVGISDFKDMVTGNYYYVDKTLFIKDILDKGDKILLITRPRRFGKTLNLSMLLPAGKQKTAAARDGLFPTGHRSERNQGRL